MYRTQYRSLARAAIERAMVELGSGQDHRLRYAALEIRSALECLTYERLIVYKDELPPDKLEIWQPRQVMDALLEVDPSADRSRAIAFAPESSPGVTSGPFQSLGTDRIVSILEIKDLYAKLGSYLHPPTIRQIEAGKISSADKIRLTCEEAARIVDEALASPVFATDFRVSCTVNCSNCDNLIIKRLPPTDITVDAQCRSCGAGYTVTRREDDTVDWKPKGVELACASESCSKAIFVFECEFKVGTFWKCQECGGRNSFALGIQFTPELSSAGPDTCGSEGGSGGSAG